MRYLIFIFTLCLLLAVGCGEQYAQPVQIHHFTPPPQLLEQTEEQWQAEIPRMLVRITPADRVFDYKKELEPKPEKEKKKAKRG